MSFGVSISDVGMLVKLAWRTVQSTRNASSEHEELSCAALGLHGTLRRLETEIQNPKSLLNKPDDSCRQEIQVIGSGCLKVLTALDKILQKYNGIVGGPSSLPKTWQKFRFGNEEMTLTDIRTKLTLYTSALSLYLNMVSIGSAGKIERQMDAAGDDLKDIKSAVNNITAHLMSNAKHEGSQMTSYADDDKAVWREFRRDLINKGFRSSLLHKHKGTIQAYVNELGSRGLMDEPSPIEPQLPVDPPIDPADDPSVIEARAEELPVDPPVDPSDDPSVIEARAEELPASPTYPKCSFDSSLDTARQRWRKQKDDQICLERHNWSQRRKRLLAGKVTENFCNVNIGDFRIAFLAAPWGLSCVCKNIDMSTLFAVFEEQVRQVQDRAAQTIRDGSSTLGGGIVKLLVDAAKIVVDMTELVLKYSPESMDWIVAVLEQESDVLPVDTACDLILNEIRARRMSMIFLIGFSELLDKVRRWIKDCQTREVWSDAILYHCDIPKLRVRLAADFEEVVPDSLQRQHLVSQQFFGIFRHAFFLLTPEKKRRLAAKIKYLIGTSVIPSRSYKEYIQLKDDLIEIYGLRAVRYIVQLIFLEVYLWTVPVYSADVEYQRHLLEVIYRVNVLRTPDHKDYLELKEDLEANSIDMPNSDGVLDSGWEHNNTPPPSSVGKKALPRRTEVPFW